MARLAASHPDIGTRAVEPPRLVVHATIDQLSWVPGAGATPPGLATCEGGGTISPGLLHRLACDAILQVVILDSHGAIVQVRDPGRLANRAIRRAWPPATKAAPTPAAQPPRLARRPPHPAVVPGRPHHRDPRRRPQSGSHAHVGTESERIRASGRSANVRPVTLMAYVDESGDTGAVSLSGSSSCYALGCVLIELDDWAAAFDRFVTFRRGLRSSLGIPLRQELKANYLIRNSGGLRKLNLSPSQRQYVYREHLRFISQLPARAFAVVTDKKKAGISGSACFDMTWEMLLQRFERTCTNENKTLLISHDEGDNDSVRRHVRKARRHLTAGSMLGGGSLHFNADKILDDPVPRASQHSYFIQMADLVAYAGWRSYMKPSKGVAQIVPQSSWSHIGGAVHSAVNRRRLNGSVPGVVLRTR